VGRSLDQDHATGNDIAVWLSSRNLVEQAATVRTVT
jgi:hypothetical protein